MVIAKTRGKIAIPEITAEPISFNTLLNRSICTWAVVGAIDKFGAYVDWEYYRLWTKSVTVGRALQVPSSCGRLACASGRRICRTVSRNRQPGIDSAQTLLFELAYVAPLRYERVWRSALSTSVVFVYESTHSRF
jgi:hypothetical protein